MDSWAQTYNFKSWRSPLEFLKRYPLSKKVMALPDQGNRFGENATMYALLNVTDLFGVLIYRKNHPYGVETGACSLAVVFIQCAII